ncbi:MAG: ROK family protein [Prevotella sp.]|jgi:glucokinase|nr:ROK family protein [Prevotella sp.]
MYSYDNRIVLTLDAGGTNFVFSAIQSNKEIVAPYCLPACPHHLTDCLHSLVKGFTHIKNQLPAEPVAISFAFPGPADYKNGIIGALPNFPSFRGGVPLGPFLQEHFRIPVFINNDGNLFAYGEALAGVLPELNERLREHGSKRQYKNLIGITFGTGFGAGVVIDNNLLIGDNDCGGDIWIFRNKRYPAMIVEESVSIRAITRVYTELSGTDDTTLTPHDIFLIAEGEKEGDKQAAIDSFAQFGEVAGDAISHLLTFTDGIVVIGGGIMGAAKYIVPNILNEMKSTLTTFAGDVLPRLQMEIFNAEDQKQFEYFLLDRSTELLIPNTGKTIHYNPHKKTVLMKTALGTSKAISLGAYSYALHKLGN